MPGPDPAGPIGAGSIGAGSIGAAQRGKCAEPVGPADRFCEGCGADLQLRHGGTDHVEIDLGVLAGVSDRGHVHARNEDAMALGRHASTLAAVVCDGVSTVRSPELASRAATEAALDVLLADPAAAAGQRTRNAVAAAARLVTTPAPPGTLNGPSCTFVSALVDRSEPERPEITIGWVGDSRAYWLAGPGAAEPARLLTADHACPLGLIRWLGQDGTSEPEVVALRPVASGVLLLCSDGLSRYLPDPEALASYVMSSAGPVQPLRAAAELTAAALDAGGRDNVTAVVVPVPVGISRGNGRVRPGAAGRAR